MKYVDRYKIENANEIRKAKIRFKVLYVAISTCIQMGMFLFIISIGAMDFNTTRAVGVMAVAVLLFLIAFGVCKIFDIEMFEVDDED